MARCTAWLLPSTARIHSQGKITFIARSVALVDPSNGWAFLKRADRNVQCHDQNSSGSTCRISSKDCGRADLEQSWEHHCSILFVSAPLENQRAARASRLCGWLAGRNP